MTRAELRALYLRVLQIATPVLVSLTLVLNEISVLRHWEGTLTEWSYEVATIALICLLATEFAVRFLQNSRPSLPRTILVARNILRGVGSVAGITFLAIFGGWLGWSAAIGLSVLFTFLWLRPPI